MSYVLDEPVVSSPKRLCLSKADDSALGLLEEIDTAAETLDFDADNEPESSLSSAEVSNYVSEPYIPPYAFGIFDLLNPSEDDIAEMTGSSDSHPL